MKRYILTIVLLLFVTHGGFGQQRFIQFVYVSDCHYGNPRHDFRGRHLVAADEVNREMISRIRELPTVEFPTDGGVRDGEKIEWVDYLINTGDIANRAERGIQRSARSWRQFSRDWGDLGLRDSAGEPTRMFLLPGNHDISNATGHPGIPRSKVDATAAAEIYNAMVQPVEPVTRRTYNHKRHLCNYFFDNSGVRFLFVDMWPDSRNRKWLDARLQDLPEDGVCLLFAHDQPDIEAKHFAGSMAEGFENLVGDRSNVSTIDEIPVAEHEALDGFLATHPAIRAYFHGNDNYNEFYVWGAASELPVFRVDSPIKGNLSYTDESMLSFQFVTVDTQEGLMTVREYLWNRTRTAPCWGKTATVYLNKTH